MASPTLAARAQRSMLIWLARHPQQTENGGNQRVKYEYSKQKEKKGENVFLFLFTPFSHGSEDLTGVSMATVGGRGHPVENFMLVKSAIGEMATSFSSSLKLLLFTTETMSDTRWRCKTGSSVIGWRAKSPVRFLLLPSPRLTEEALGPPHHHSSALPPPPPAIISTPHLGPPHQPPQHLPSSPLQ